MPKSLASFCRLCLTKTASKVPVFGGDQENVTNLLALIELSINPETESDAVLCFDCVVTLETFLQYKNQCHVNDAFLKTLPPKDSAEDSEASEDEEDADAKECSFLQVDDDGADSVDSELVEVVEPQKRAKIKVSPKPKKLIRKAKQFKVVKIAEDPLNIKRSSRVQRKKPRPELSPKKKLTEPSKPVQEIPEFAGPQPTEDELPKLLDSYPNYFHFERGSRSLYYNLVYYGERFNSAVYGPSYTYWQCSHRSKFKCPALLHVTNDYTEFERRFEHTHGDQKSKGKPELLTPKQALPTVFRICWHRVKEKRIKRKQAKDSKKGLKSNEDHEAAEETISEKKMTDNEVLESGEEEDDYF